MEAYMSCYLKQFTLCFRPPGKSGFQVARCIAVYSNNFSYDMKAKWNTKINFQPKTGRWNSWGDLSCFRGTSTYASTKLESLFYHLILLLVISRLFVCHSIYMQKSLPRYSGSLHRSLKYSDIRTQSVLPVSMEYKISTWKVYLSQSPRNTKHNVGNYKFSI